jgi:uncharacterized membrane protein required for colicin V production
MDLSALPFNGFDLVLVVVIGLGLSTGRKAGMSGELLRVAKWLAILFVCAVAYEPVGSFFNQSTGMFSALSCYLIAYVGAALVVVLLFLGLHRVLGGKLLGSDVFGKSEYYLGMGSGALRAACMLLVAMALLNARYFSPKEVKAEEKFQDDMYGSHYFPGLHSVQAVVFERSLTGPWIRDHLGFLLIKPTEPDVKELHQKEATWQ